MHPCSGGTSEHHVGGATLDGDRGLTNGQMAAGFTDGDRITRAAEVVVDGNVAGGHVRQILQQPQRCQLRHTVDSPALEIKLPRGVAALGHTGGEILREREHVIRAKHTAKPFRLVLVGTEPTAVQRPLRRGHRHLALAAHHLEPLADRLFLLRIERTEVVDLSGKAAGFGGMVERQALRRKRFQRPHGAGACQQSGPHILQRQAQRTDRSHARDHHTSLLAGSHEQFSCSQGSKGDLSHSLLAGCEYIRPPLAAAGVDPGNARGFREGGGLPAVGCGAVSGSDGQG